MTKLLWKLWWMLWRYFSYPHPWTGSTWNRSHNMIDPASEVLDFYLCGKRVTI